MLLKAFLSGLSAVGAHLFAATGQNNKESGLLAASAVSDELHEKFIHVPQLLIHHNLSLCLLLHFMQEFAIGSKPTAVIQEVVADCSLHI